MMERWSWRLGYLGLAFLMTWSLVLSGAGIASSSRSMQKITLKFWQPDTRAAWLNALNLVIKDYKAQHPNVDVSFTTTDWNTLLPKLTAAVAAGSAPDLFYFDTPALAYGAYSEHLTQPLTDVIKNVGASRWPASMIAPVTVDGQIDGFPLYTYPQVLWYRTDLFKKAGLQPPTSLHNIMVAAQTLNKPPKMYGVALYNDQDDPQIVVQLLASNGSRLFDNNGNVVINSAQTVRGLDYLRQLWKTASPDAISKADLDARLVFYTGGAAMDFTSVSLADELVSKDSKIRPDQVAAIPVPSDSGLPSVNALFATLVIPRNAPNAAEAKRFLQFWAQPQEMLKFGENTVIGHIPVLNSVFAPNSPYWTSPRIAPVARFLKAGIAGAAKGGFIGGFWPKPNKCGPKVLAAGIYTQMVSHMVVDGWSAKQTASWAQQQITSSVCTP